MTQRIRLIALVVIAAGALSLATAATLSQGERAKIHPDFQALLARTYPDINAAGGSVSRLTVGTVPGAENTFHAIVYTNDPDAVRAAGATVNSVYPGFVTAQVTAAQVLALARLEGVRYIDEGSVNYPANDVSIPETGASLVQGGFLNSTQYRGSGAIVLVYDTGIDWKHMDFRVPSDPTKSRILFIWDQTLTATGGEAAPSGFGYGVEYSNTQISAELGSSPPGVVREKDINGHGTHVCGTAAGNGLTFGKFGGMAPDADIIIVKGGDATFSESRMVDGLTYAESMATALHKPISVNWSIGGQIGPHDGTRAYEVAVNSFVANPGRVVAIAAGNDGGSLIHTGGTAGATTTFTFTVPTYTASSGTGTNQFLLDLWLNSNTNVSASAMSPDGFTAAAAYNASGTATDGSNTGDGLFTVYNIPSFTSNGAWNVQFWVRDDGTHFPKAGTWTLTVTNPGAAVRYDGWLAYKTLGNATATLAGADGNETLSMPGTAAGAITAAAYVTKWTWPVYANLQYLYNGTDRTSNIASFSAVGPTRDNRQKPDVAAPGMGIASSLSTFTDTTGLASLIYPGQKHWIDQGTSMATPHITGGAAVILGAFPSATAAQIKSLFTSGAVVDAFTGSVPNMTWGYGKFDMLEAMAKKLSSSAVVTRTQYSYDGTGANAIRALTGAAKFAVRISPTVTGQLTGVTLNVTTPNNNPIQGTGNIILDVYSNSSGFPGTKMGSSVTFPLTHLNPGTLNYIQMLGSGVNVTSGVDFHVVVSIANPSETLLFRTDSLGTVTNHASTFNGSSWAVDKNHRIRAIVTTGNGLASVTPGQGNAPIAFALQQNYPNPFNPSTRIAYTVGERGLVTLEVFDLLGRRVSTLVNEIEAAGSYQIAWDGRNSANQPVTSGVYFYRLRSGAFEKTSRMVLLK